MNEDQQKEQIVNDLKKLASELNRTPLRDEFTKFYSKRTIVNLFGGYTPLLQLAGLDHKQVSKKVTNDIFIKQIPDELFNKHFITPSSDLRLQIAGDFHLPWYHKKTVENFYVYNRQDQPDYVIQIGDLYDLYASSRFPKSLNLYTPKEEEKRAREEAQKFWYKIQQDNPTVKCIQLIGNHDVRPLKRVLERAPELEHMVQDYMERLLMFDKVQTIMDSREVHFLGNIGLHHGYLSKLGDHRDHNLCNMIVGHTHVGGVGYRSLRDRVIWELNVGLMGDPTAKNMGYTPVKETKWTLGFGKVHKGSPQFIAT